MTGRIARLAVVTAAASAVVASVARAGAIRHDRNDADYVAVGNDSRYAAVGSVTWLLGLARGSGTLISPRWVLTAGHVVDTSGTRTFRAGGTASNNGTAFSGAQNIPHENWSSSAILAGYDIGLVRLSSPVTTITPASRFTASDEVGRVGTSVGFGIFGTGSSPPAAELNSLKRGGTNVIDALGSAAYAGAGDNMIAADFDDPGNADGLNPFGSADPLNLEYCVSSGDSGGGVFVDVGARSFIAGVHSFVEDPYSTADDDSGYHDTFGSSRVSVFNAWIDDKICRNWNNPAGGSFATGGNWTGGLPDQYDIAGFNTGGTYTVTIAAPTISHRLIARNGNVTLNLGGSTYTLTSFSYEGSLIVGRYGGNTASLTVNNGILTTRETVLGEQATSSGTLTIGSGGTWNVVGDVYAGGNFIAAGGSGTLVLNAGSSTTITGKLKLHAGGTVNLAGGSLTAATLINGGTFNWAGGALSVSSVQIDDGGSMTLPAGADKVLKSMSVAVDTPDGAKLDLGDNKLVTATPIGTISALVAAGRNGGVWNGSGITTSMTDATGGSGYTSLGVALGSEVRGIGAADTALWGGVTVTGSETLVMYTYGGDANLSGFVDVDDYGQIDFNALAGGVLTGWFNGDFDYNGFQDVDDYGIIDFVFNIQGAAFLTSDPVGATLRVASVPEPAGVGLGVMAMAMLLARRRR